jgi:hypothetical protein
MLLGSQSQDGRVPLAACWLLLAPLTPVSQREGKVPLSLPLLAGLLYLLDCLLPISCSLARSPTSSMMM